MAGNAGASLPVAKARIFVLPCHGSARRTEHGKQGSKTVSSSQSFMAAAAAGATSSGSSVSGSTSLACLPVLNKNGLLAACAAMNLTGDTSELIQTARDISSLMAHSRDELVGACKALGLQHGGNKTVLSERLIGHLRPLSELYVSHGAIFFAAAYYQLCRVSISSNLTEWSWLQ